MKKTYINPETNIILLAGQIILSGSVEGFNEKIDEDNTINPDQMLSREHRRTVWDDEEEEEY